MPELDDALLTLVVAAGLRAEEPISVWLRSDPDDREDLQLRAGDHALLMCDGLVEYHVDSAAVLVLDHRDPRAMRSQRYEPDIRQPYLPPHIEERGEDWA